MRISTKGRYGLRALLELALCEGNAPVSLTEIAERQDLSVGYLEPIFAALKRAGIVQAAAGVKGGYRLCGEPKSITAAQVLAALEGDFRSEEAENAGMPALRLFLEEQVWKKLDEEIWHTLETTTLGELLETFLQNGEASLYHSTL